MKFCIQAEVRFADQLAEMMSFICDTVENIDVRPIILRPRRLKSSCRAAIFIRINNKTVTIAVIECNRVGRCLNVIRILNFQEELAFIG